MIVVTVLTVATVVTLVTVVTVVTVVILVTEVTVLTKKKISPKNLFLLKKNLFVHTQKITQIKWFSNTKKFHQQFKNSQIVMKLKNSNCYETQFSNCDETQKQKL